MPLERKKTLNVFKDAQHAWGSYDDFPVGEPGTDPMPHVSRNRVRQAFYLVSEADQVLIQLAGEGEISFKEIEPAKLLLFPGDTVYIPAGVPSRLTPYGENVQVRLKAEPAVAEAVAWYCESCDELVHAVSIAAGLPHQAYWQAVQEFNQDVQLRTCRHCAALHPVIELGDIAWPAVAAALRAMDSAQLEK
jgi:3-hydroxyanthranilate 3,4-dioxygenase